MNLSLNAPVSINSPLYDLNGNLIAGSTVLPALGYASNRLSAGTVTITNR